MSAAATDAEHIDALANLARELEAMRLERNQLRDELATACTSISVARHEGWIAGRKRAEEACRGVLAIATAGRDVVRPLAAPVTVSQAQLYEYVRDGAIACVEAVKALQPDAEPKPAEPAIAAGDLRVDFLQAGNYVTVTVTHLPTGAVGRAQGTSGIEAKKLAIAELRTRLATPKEVDAMALETVRKSIHALAAQQGKGPTGGR